MASGLFAVLLVAPVLGTLNFQVEPKQQECFYQDLKAGETHDMDFEVLRGGLLDIKLKVEDPMNSILVDKLAFFNRQDEELNEAEGRVTFVATNTGIHKICFDNRMSRWTAKVCSFTIKNKAAKPAHEEIAKLEHLGPVVDSVIKIADELDVLEKLQHHMRVKEQSHFDVSMTTGGRVQWMSMLEAVLLISISLLQVTYIQKWFNDPVGGPMNMGGRV